MEKLPQCTRSRYHTLPISINGHTIEGSDQFQYLGRVVSADRGTELGVARALTARGPLSLLSLKAGNAPRSSWNCSVAVERSHIREERQLHCRLWRGVKFTLPRWPPNGSLQGHLAHNRRKGVLIWKTFQINSLLWIIMCVKYLFLFACYRGRGCQIGEFATNWSCKHRSPCDRYKRCNCGSIIQWK